MLDDGRNTPAHNSQTCMNCTPQVHGMKMTSCINSICYNFGLGSSARSQAKLQAGARQMTGNHLLCGMQKRNCPRPPEDALWIPCRAAALAVSSSPCWQNSMLCTGFLSFMALARKSSEVLSISMTCKTAETI